MDFWTHLMNAIDEDVFEIEFDEHKLVLEQKIDHNSYIPYLESCMEKFSDIEKCNNFVCKINDYANLIYKGVVLYGMDGNKRMRITLYYDNYICCMKRMSEESIRKIFTDGYVLTDFLEYITLKIYESIELIQDDDNGCIIVRHKEK